MTTKNTPGRERARQLVEEARAGRGISQEALAGEAGISTKTYYNFLQGSWPLARALRGLERALGFTPMVLDDVADHDDPDSITVQHLTAGVSTEPTAAELSDQDLTYELTRRLQQREADLQRAIQERDVLRAEVRELLARPAFALAADQDRSGVGRHLQALTDGAGEESQDPDGA